MFQPCWSCISNNRPPGYGSAPTSCDTLSALLVRTPINARGTWDDDTDIEGMAEALPGETNKTGAAMRQRYMI